MAYEVQTIGDATDGADAPLAPRPELSPAVKLGIAGVVALALIYNSKGYRKWERSLSGGQRFALAAGVAGAFVLILLAAAAKKQREMQSFHRDPPPNADNVPIT